MPSIDNAPIIKAWAEDTSNKDAPSQTAIGTGIEYASPLVSSEPNGALYLIFKAVKYLQRTGGMYSPTIPYIRGQSCSLLCVSGTRYEIRQFICDSATDITNTPPLTGATVTDVNGVSCYSGGVLSASWQDAANTDGYAQTSLNVAGGPVDVPRFAVVNCGKYQYYNPSNTTASGINPPNDGDAVLKSPTLDEILGMMHGIWYPPYLTQSTSVAAHPLRRLGAYWYLGIKVEAFGMFLSGQVFTDNGTSIFSKFWRSFDATTGLAICNRTTLRSELFSGTSGGSITPRKYQGRVPACVGTPSLVSGTADARAELGATQEDQLQGHWHDLFSDSQAGNGMWHASSAVAQGGNVSEGTGRAYTRGPTPDTAHGTPRVGSNTRENTYSVPVPMVVSLLPYGSITL